MLCWQGLGPARRRARGALVMGVLGAIAFPQAVVPVPLSDRKRRTTVGSEPLWKNTDGLCARARSQYS
eukprot:17011-Alexandrium_andersonii.AAC.1